MTSLLYLGLGVTLIAIVALSVWSGTQVKNGQQQNSMPVVAGVIMGTLVGGSSSIGTAQLAYSYGMSAWCFTLGAGIACLILALVYAKPLRRSGCATLVGIIRREYGNDAGMTVSILSAIGTFIAIISQLISATAVIAVVFPALGLPASVAITMVFMVLYVIFGGTKGTGMVGIVKMALLYVTMIACGVLVLRMVGGLTSFTDMVNAIDNPNGIRFFSLFARGVSTDGGACLSLILGVLTTQTYAQGVLSGKTDRDGVGGALVSAFLIPPIGIGGILVGLYMRANAALYPGITAKTALTTFVTAHMPPLLAGVILGALFVAVVGTGAGLALGISTMVNNDIVGRLTHRFDDEKKRNILGKIWIVVVLAIAGCLSCGALGDTILQFSFMSMGLRGAVVFTPLLCALWLPGRIHRRYAITSAIVGPVIVLIFGVWKVFPIDSLFLGIAASLLIMGIGLVMGKKNLEA